MVVVGVRGAWRGIRRRGWTTHVTVAALTRACRDSARQRESRGTPCSSGRVSSLRVKFKTRRPTPLRSASTCGTATARLSHVLGAVSPGAERAPEPRRAAELHSQCASDSQVTLLHHHHHRTRHRPCQHSLLLSNLHVTATMSRPYDLSKVDLKPKRHHGYSVLIFIFGTLFPPLGPSTSLHRSTQWLIRSFSYL